jgi:hypothetical protein
MTSKSAAPLQNLRWSKSDHDLMINLLRAGKPYKYIAKSLGRTQKSVEQHAYATRLTLRKAGISEPAIAELIPTNYPSRQRKKVVVKEPAEIKRPEPKPAPIQIAEPKDIESAAFERRLVELYVVNAISAIGIWILAGAFIYSLL